MKKKEYLLYGFGVLFILGFFFFSSYTGGDDPEPEPNSNKKLSHNKNNSTAQNVLSFDVPAKADFAGEPMPLDNFDVRERLNRELLVNTFWHSNTILNIQKLSRFFPVIEPILKEEGVPDDFKYLCVAESSLRNAVSPAGAKGFWQFMKETGKSYKLEVNKQVDERYHLEKSTRAACKFLKFLKNEFNSWTMAAAAYNMGGRNLNKNCAEQKTRNYYDLNLNSETARYIFRIVALKEVLKQPEKYGFHIDEKHTYPPLDNFEIIEVNSSIANWADWAKKYNMSYRMLKVYNPWLVSSSLSNRSGKTYRIKVAK